MNLRTCLCVIFVLKLRSTKVYSDLIDSKMCTLTNNPANLDANQIKEKYWTESGFGVANLLKVNETMVANLQDQYKIKHICACFYSRGNNPWFDISLLRNTADMTTIYLDFTYCVKYIEWWSYSPTYCSPLVMCKIGEEEFYLAESKVTYEEQKFRNMFKFKLKDEEKKALMRSREKKIYYPMGQFEAFYSMVDLEYFVVNEISYEECKLNDIQMSNGEATKQAELKNQFYSEFGYGVLNYAKLDWGPITGLQEKYIQAMCLCFAKIYYRNEEITRNLSKVGVKTNYYYGKKYTGWFKRFVRSPVVQCTIPKISRPIFNLTFYLAESVKFYFSRRFRNVYLFRLYTFDSKHVKKSENGNEFIINDPAGTFELFAPAVDLTKCYNFGNIPTNS